MQKTVVDLSSGKIEIVDLDEHDLVEMQQSSHLLSDQEFSQLIGRAVDMKLDRLAQSWQYRDYISARSYVGDVSAKYAAEGAALAAYGSQCWTLIEQLALDVLQGRAEMPTSVEAVLAMLPEEPSRPTH